MRIDRVWAMPSMHTFTILPIKQLLLEEMGQDELWIDPFAGENSLAKITNDLNPNKPTMYHMQALDFLKMFDDESVDGVLYDPPYTLRQVKECYDEFGIDISWDGRCTFWSDQLDEIRRIVKPHGKLIKFGYNSNGAGNQREFTMTRILLVPHGGPHNDTIVTVEEKQNNKVKRLF